MSRAGCDPTELLFVYQQCSHFAVESISRFLFNIKNLGSGASLVAQWLRVRLLMQGTWVRAPVQEDPTCRGAAGPVSHGCWACASGATGEATAVRGPRTAKNNNNNNCLLEVELKITI